MSCLSKSIHTLLLTACVSNHLEAETSARKPLGETFENSARSRWDQKPVFESKLLDDAEHPETWTHDDLGTMSFTTERAKDGKQSVRLESKTKGDKPTKDNRPWGYCSAVRSVSNEDWSKWNRLSLWIYPDLPGHKTISAYIHVMTGGKSGSRDNVILKGGQWNHVTTEFESLPRSAVTGVAIRCRLSGNEPGTSDTFTYDIDHLELQRVIPDHYQGWSCAPGKIAFSHTGYAIGSPKSALASDLVESKFNVVDATSGKVVLSKPVNTVTTYRGTFQTMDFSELDQPGTYFLQAGERKTGSFRIDNEIWLEPIEKALNWLYVQRIGFAVPGVHDAGSLDWRAKNGDKSVSIAGGWYDAGDLSQALYNTAEATFIMFQLAERLQRDHQNPALVKQLTAEATWGLDWLLKTTLHDGLRPLWGVQGWWTNGIVGDNDDLRAGMGRSTSKFMVAAAAEAVAYRMLKESDPAHAAASLKTAEEDWGFAIENSAKDLARDETCEAASEIVIASIELFKTTGNRKYADKALELAPQLVESQERNFIPGTEAGICGFLYGTPKKERILHSVFGSGAHEHAQLIALTRLCEAFPDDARWMDWYSAVAMYGDLHKKIVGNTAPYNMLPSGLYQKEEYQKTWESARSRMQQQILAAQPLGSDYVVRAFPANDGHFGQLHLQLSQAKGVALGAQLRGDLGAAQLAAQQLEWTLGRNPFSRSFMYGEGYDYTPQYSPMCGNIVGALPTGLQSFGIKDEPYWPVGENKPSPNEQWIQTISRFIYLAGDLLGPAQMSGSSTSTVQVRNEITGAVSNVQPDSKGGFHTTLPQGNYVITADKLDHHVVALPNSSYRLDPDLDFTVTATTDSKDRATISLTANGKGSHTFSIRTSNLATEDETKTINLQPGIPQHITWAGTVTSKNSPWFAVVVPDGDIARRKEALPAPSSE